MFTIIIIHEHNKWGKQAHRPTSNITCAVPHPESCLPRSLGVACVNIGPATPTTLPCPHCASLSHSFPVTVCVCVCIHVHVNVYKEVHMYNVHVHYIILLNVTLP